MIARLLAFLRSLHRPERVTCKQAQKRMDDSLDRLAAAVERRFSK